MKRFLVLALLATFAAPSPASAAHIRGCNTTSCDERVKRACWADRDCRERVIDKQLVAEMRGYKARPMPYCTWGPESSWDPATGRNFDGRPFAPGRYLVQNPSSTASGKFQFLTSTWQSIGGGRYAHEAWQARPVYQERMARRLMSRAGLSPWVGC